MNTTKKVMRILAAAAALLAVGPALASDAKHERQAAFEKARPSVGNKPEAGPSPEIGARTCACPDSSIRQSPPRPDPEAERLRVLNGMG